MKTLGKSRGNSMTARGALALLLALVVGITGRSPAASTSGQSADEVSTPATASTSTRPADSAPADGASTAEEAGSALEDAGRLVLLCTAYLIFPCIGALGAVGIDALVNKIRCGEYNCPPGPPEESPEQAQEEESEKRCAELASAALGKKPPNECECASLTAEQPFTVGSGVDSSKKVGIFFPAPDGDAVHAECQDNSSVIRIVRYHLPDVECARRMNATCGLAPF